MSDDLSSLAVIVEPMVTENGRAHGPDCRCLVCRFEYSSMRRLSLRPEYEVWAGMKRRCRYPSQPSYKYYGARGITVCERWLKSFEVFVEDMGSRPNPRHSIDRIDPNGNYESSNCRWATADEQSRNQRPRGGRPRKVGS